MHGTIELPAMRRAADLLPATLDEQDRSIEVVWSTGARVRRQPLFGEPFDEELSMDPGSVRLERLNAGGPLLKVHDLRTLDSVIGSVVPGTARIDSGRGIARVRFSERDDVAASATMSSRSGPMCGRAICGPSPLAIRSIASRSVDPPMRRRSGARSTGHLSRFPRSRSGPIRRPASVRLTR